MKCFLKPTGRLLTTAVFTSTAFEPFAAALATPTPLADDPPSDANSQSVTDEVSAETLPPKAKTVIPPEVLMAQEFAHKPPSLTPFQINAESPEAPLLPLMLDPTGDLAQTSPSVPPIDFAFQPIPDLANTADAVPPDAEKVNPEATDREATDPEAVDPEPAHSAPSNFLSSGSAASDFEISSPDTPNPDTPDPDTPDPDTPDPDQTDFNSVESRLDSASVNPDLRAVQPLSQADNTPDPQASNPQAIAPNIAPDEEIEEDMDDDDVLNATREWLDETLARIVNRDRLNREQQFRENLVQTARDFLAQGNIEQAKRILDNPALTETEREELRVAIAEIESNATYPFVSVDHALALTTRAIRDQPRPSRDWLLSQMDAAVESLDPTCYDGEQPALSAVMPTGTSSPGVPGGVWQQDSGSLNSGGSGQEDFRSGGEFLSGVGHQPPSMTERRSLPPRTRSVAENQPMARRENCTPTFGQNIGGLTFATLSGYQWITQFSRPGNILRMVFPLAIPAAITSRFGWRTHPIYGDRRFHFGIDFGAPSGTPVIAAVPGRVTTSNYLDGYGLTVILENQDLEQRTLYAHMSGIAVRPGTWIEQGDIIGWVGSTGNSTGPHLHFEVHQRQGGDWVAVDPLHAAAQLIANRPGVPVP